MALPPQPTKPSSVTRTLYGVLFVTATFTVRTIPFVKRVTPGMRPETASSADATMAPRFFARASKSVRSASGATPARRDTTSHSPFCTFVSTAFCVSPNEVLVPPLPWAWSV